MKKTTKIFLAVIVLVIVSVSICVFLLKSSQPEAKVTYVGINVGSNIFLQNQQVTVTNNSGTFTDTFPYNDTGMFLAYENYYGSNNFPGNYYVFSVSLQSLKSRLASSLYAGSSNASGGSENNVQMGNNGNPINAALQPLLNKYSLLSLLVWSESDYSPFESNIPPYSIGTVTVTDIKSLNIPVYAYTYNGDGNFSFTLYSNNNNVLTNQQISSLARDLQAALTKLATSN